MTLVQGFERPRRVRQHLWLVPVVLLGAPALLLVLFAWWMAHLGLGTFEKGSDLRPPPPAAQYGTPAEIGTRGDRPNPGRRYHGAYPSGAETQERGPGRPGRLSGYTVWVEAADLVPANRLVDGYAGHFVRVEVKIFNRDVKSQRAGAADFSIWHATAGERAADAVATQPGTAELTNRALHGRVDLHSGGQVRGFVYLYVGDTANGIFLRYRPADDWTEAEAVWSLAELL